MSSEKRKYELRVRAERLAETRQRIVEAAASLHAEVGPARTTVVEIARRAGVGRDTVYSHFPDDGELFTACGDYSMTKNPPPDLSGALALDDAAARLQAVLTAFYSWYREMAPGMVHLQRDRLILPALDAAMTNRVDQPIAVLIDTLVAGFSPEGSARDGLHALVALALDFWTWKRLASEGLMDENASKLMVAAVEAAAAGCAARPATGAASAAPPASPSAAPASARRRPRGRTGAG